MADKEKMAPVQGYSVGIPWSMHLRVYDAYCKKWGAQQALIDLEGRNCRGGFHVSELDEFIPGWREELSELAKLRAENAELRRLLGEVCKAGRSAYAVVKAYGPIGPVCRELYAAVATAEECLKKTGE